MTKRPKLLPCRTCGAAPFVDNWLHPMLFINCPTVYLFADKHDENCEGYAESAEEWNAMQSAVTHTSQCNRGKAG